MAINEADRFQTNFEFLAGNPEQEGSVNLQVASEFQNPVNILL
jgi:hypothetical protein